MAALVLLVNVVFVVFAELVRVPSLYSTATEDSDILLYTKPGNVYGEVGGVKLAVHTATPGTTRISSTPVSAPV